MMDFVGRTVLVVGAGISGIAACRYLIENKSKVILADNKSRDALLANKDIAKLVDNGCELILDNQIPDKINWDLVIVSPGVPLYIPVLNISREKNIKIIGEIELAYAAANAPFIGITGTNGKTTTTALVGHILQTCGIDALVGGNIGKALVDSVTDFHGEYIVAELSSFQLETCEQFRPKVAAYLNLTPDHLDRHGDMIGYGAAKERIFAQQTQDDYAILNYDDSLVCSVAKKIESAVLWFSLHHRPQYGICLEEGKLRYFIDGKEKFAFLAADIFIKGRHNIQNAMAAFLIAAAIGINPEEIAKAIISFKGVEHRLEYVTTKDGIIYVNDSKGTNPASTIQAIWAYDNPMILLLGGRNKGSDFTGLMSLVMQRVKRVIIYGEAANEIKQAANLAGFKNYTMADDFTDAVKQAKEQANAGDVVMLSPACASWDSFSCFEERGERFKELIL
jgi:UDP-N-acetylmuramoylalanine--D-glutamate ligase